MASSAAPSKPEKRRRQDRQFRIMFRPTGPFTSAAPVAPAIADPPPRRKISRILGLTSPPTTLVDDLCSKLVEKSSHWALVVLKAPLDPEEPRIPISADDSRIERVYEIRRVPRHEGLKEAEENEEEGDEEGLFEGGDEQGEVGSQTDGQGEGGSQRDQQGEGSSQGNVQGEGSSQRDQQGDISSQRDQQGDISSQRDEQGEGSSQTKKGKEKESGMYVKGKVKWGRWNGKGKGKGKELEAKGKGKGKGKEREAKGKAKCTERVHVPRPPSATTPDDSSEDDRHEDDAGFPEVNEKGKYLKMQVSEKPRFDFAELQCEHLGGPLWEILTGIEARTKFTNTELKHEASRIWKRQQNYHLIDNNCQRFCILMAITIRAKNHSLLRVLHGKTVKKQIKDMKLGGAKK